MADRPSQKLFAFAKPSVRFATVGGLALVLLGCGGRDKDSPATTTGTAGGTPVSGTLSGTPTGTPPGTPTGGTTSTETCTGNQECTGDQECITGACIDPVPDPSTYALDAATRPSSYVRDLQLPAGFDPAERCCFDYTGSGTVDDALGTFWSLIASTPGLAAELPDPEAQVRAGSPILVLDWTHPPSGSDGPVRFSVFTATAGSPFDWSAVEGGGGSFTLDADAFGTHGAHHQFNNGTVTGNTVVAGPGDLSITLGGDTLLLQQVRFELPITIESGGIRTVDETRTSQDPVATAGGKLGGVLDGESFLHLIETRTRACACAGVDPTQPFFSWSPNPTSGVTDITCTASYGGTLTNTCTPADPALCNSLDLICGVAPLLGTIYDVDLNGDGVNDAMSVGARVSLATASITGVQ